MNRKEIVKHLTETANEVQGDINAYERKAGQLRQGMVHLRRSDMFVAKGDFANATKESIDAVKYLPDCIEAIRSAADTHFSMEQYSQALSYYVDLIKKYPSLRDIHYQIGRCYTELKDHPKAIPEYEKEIALSGEAPDVHLQIGFAYQRVAEDILHTMNKQPIADSGKKRTECKAAFTKAKENYAKGIGAVDQDTINDWIRDIDAVLKTI